MFAQKLLQFASCWYLIRAKRPNNNNIVLIIILLNRNFPLIIYLGTVVETQTLRAKRLFDYMRVGKYNKLTILFELHIVNINYNFGTMYYFFL